jgi:serine O-acetyltransferase
MILNYYRYSASKRINFDLKLSAYFKIKNMPLISKIILKRIQKKYGVFIPFNAKICLDVKFPHPVGIVIGDKVVIGNDVIIYQNVTLGGARIGDAENSHYPVIGSGTVIFAGAVILGKVKIGKNCIIGANAVVLKDVPDNQTVVGVPAKLIDTKNNGERV